MTDRRKKLAAALLLAMTMCLGFIASAAEGTPDGYRKAVGLYEKGMFERAETMFGQIKSETGDVMASGYEVLCAVRLQEKGYQTRVSEFIADNPYSSLIPQIRFYNALNLFDSEDYRQAAIEFGRLNERQLYLSQIPEYAFKEAYCAFEDDNYDKAQELFLKAEKMPQSDFTAPSRYSLGYISYANKNFDEAYDWFEKSAKDPRFSDQALSYMIECRYMRKDYNYVIEKGTEIFPKVSTERQPHLAKLISESYLAKDQPAKAKEYYDKIGKSRSEMDEADLFYAGTVLYATKDYEGAIENFSGMKERTDSIGQIANYELGYSYIQTGNKVAALDAFKSASEKSYNPDVQEDAHFNYAKLSFDLNHNPSAFNEYMAKYPDVKKSDTIYGYMALASLYGHDYAGAVEAYSNIDMLDKDQRANYMRANYLRANQLIESGSWKDAVPLLKAASYYSGKGESFYQLSKYWLGESYYRSDQYDNSIETFKDLYNNSALDGKEEGELIPYDLAYNYFRKGDYDNAAKWFDQYLDEKNPSEGEDAAARRADCDFIRKDYASAIKEYQAACKRFSYSDNLYPYLRAGIAYGLTGDKAGKVNVLSKVLDASPSAEYYSEAMYELGRAYVATDKTDDAVATFKKLRANSNDKTISVRSLIELGMIARNNSDYDQAIEYYKQVIDEMPQTEYSSDALQAIESIYQSQGRTSEYLDYADKIGANSGKTDLEKEDMYFNAAEQVFFTENYSKALISLQSYLDKYPEGAKVAQADYYVAECYKNLGNKEQACDWYDKSIEKDDTGTCSESAKLNFAKLSYDIQHYKDAFGGYSALLSDAKIDANKHTARVGMMLSAFKGQDWDNAISCSSKVKADKKSTADELRQAEYVTAKSNLSLGNRDTAFEIFRTLSAKPGTDEGAEATYMLIQDAYDQGKYDTVQSKVYKFSENAGDQSYWLAKAFIVLGDSFAEQDNMKQAKATFESILNGYTPSGTSDDVLDNVRMRLSKLNNTK